MVKNLSKSQFIQVFTKKKKNRINYREQIFSEKLGKSQLIQVFTKKKKKEL
jgi:hypothetical protein